MQASNASIDAGTEHNIWNPSADSDSDSDNVSMGSHGSTDRGKEERGIGGGAKTPPGIIVFSD